MFGNCRKGKVKVKVMRTSGFQSLARPRTHQEGAQAAQTLSCILSTPAHSFEAWAVSPHFTDGVQKVFQQGRPLALKPHPTFGHLWFSPAGRVGVRACVNRKKAKPSASLLEQRG